MTTAVAYFSSLIHGEEFRSKRHRQQLASRTLIFFVLLTLASSLPSLAKKKPSEETTPAAAGFPAPYTKVVRGAVRFEDPVYFSLMASDGINKVDAKPLYLRLQAAVAANERYKALYLARIFTQLKPDTAAAWNNRAQLASALGLADEANACAQNAKDPAHLVAVPLTGVLPGAGLAIKPASLADWAAATALLSDGIAEKQGKQSLVAFKDSISGIHEATKEEVDRANQENQDAGLPAAGPWATPEPVQIHHVLANVFAERGADPMHYNSMSKGGMFGAMLMAGMSGMEQNTNPVAASQSMDVAQQMAGRASQVPSHYKGGAYTRVTYDNGKEVDAPDHPQSAGLDKAVATPLPFLWASGGSTNPYFAGSWRSNQGSKVKKITASNLDDVQNSRAKEYRPPQEMQFPKLMSMCVSNNPSSNRSCSDPLTLMELLLSRDDVAALAPNLTGSDPNLEMYRTAYNSGYFILQPGNGGGSLMWGADSDGAIYPLNPGATSWLISSH